VIFGFRVIKSQKWLTSSLSFSFDPKLSFKALETSFVALKLIFEALKLIFEAL
jgi:hypothetical protein